jgi:TolB-like protein/class 3 adenylate cyclase/Tfp pilus assembly protein PilF
MAENRRLAAIMAVDVVGYSRLMGEDEAGTAQAVREHRDAARPVVAGLGGRIVKTMGDGLLLEFPSVIAAVECAVAIQTLMVERNADVPEAKRVVYRIGVNLGDVLIEGDDILGEGVNIAVRLEAICEPGGVLVSSAAHDHVRGKIDAEFVDLGEKSLKNIARPARAYAVRTNHASTAPASPAAAPARQGPPRLSIVVLPFPNLGGDAEQDYFADGVTENLTTDLSRIRGSFVIGRNTAFTYKGKAVDLKQIGRELNVRYVLEGSVRRGGDRMRVNVQLIDAESGHHLWAERFDKPLADLFDMQDEIVARLAVALNAQLVDAEAQRAEKVASPDAIDFYFQGLAWLNKGFHPDTLAKALGFFDSALSLDPDNADVLIGSARADSYTASVLGADIASAFSSAEAKLTKALSLVPDHARAHVSLGVVYIFTKRAAQGVAECEHALALDRNLAHAHSLIGMGKTLIGRPEETEAHIREAMRLSPRDPMAYLWLHWGGLAKICLGLWDQAVECDRRSVEANRNFWVAHILLAAALARLDRWDEARACVKSGLALNPGMSVARARALWTSFSDHPAYLATLEPVFEVLPKAGLPEP